MSPFKHHNIVFSRGGSLYLQMVGVVLIMYCFKRCLKFTTSYKNPWKITLMTKRIRLKNLHFLNVNEQAYSLPISKCAQEYFRIHTKLFETSDSDFSASDLICFVICLKTTKGKTICSDWKIMFQLPKSFFATLRMQQLTVNLQGISVWSSSLCTFVSLCEMWESPSLILLHCTC